MSEAGETVRWGIHPSTQLLISRPILFLVTGITLTVWAFLAMRKQASLWHTALFLISMALLATLVQYWSLSMFHISDMGGLSS